MDRKQAVIIGLGQFGSSLAQTLAARGVDVLAIDSRREPVQALTDVVAEALCFDATDEQRLMRVAPQRRDICVCAIGPEARDSAIIVTALLRQMGAKRIVSRAADPLMTRIITLVGAHEVINPERAFGERLANRLLYEAVLEEFPLGDDLVVTEIRPPSVIVGRKLQDLSLLERAGLNVVAVRRVIDGKGRALIPRGNEVIGGDDILVVVSAPGAVQRLLEVTS
jgi:trk system potassium uptake protein